MHPQHFVSDLTDIRIKINPQIQIRFLDHCRLTFWRRFALSECSCFFCCNNSGYIMAPYKLSYYYKVWGFLYKKANGNTSSSQKKEWHLVAPPLQKVGLYRLTAPDKCDTIVQCTAKASSVQCSIVESDVAGWCVHCQQGEEDRRYRLQWYAKWLQWWWVAMEANMWQLAGDKIPLRFVVVLSKCATKHA